MKPMVVPIPPALKRKPSRAHVYGQYLKRHVDGSLGIEILIPGIALRNASAGILNPNLDIKETNDPHKQQWHHKEIQNR
jgi:hypothetical protein